MKDESAAAHNEMDVLKFYVWLMLLMTVVLAVIFYVVVWRNLESTAKNLELGKKLMKDFADDQSAIEGMLKTHKNNKEDVARDQPLTWFSTAWRKCGIVDGSMEPRAWKVPPDINPRGHFAEESIEMGLNARSPLSREQIAHFCHEIEKSSTRLRIIVLDIRRTDRDNYEKDEWAGKVLVGYRHTP